MASHSSKVYLCLGRINASFLGVSKTINRTIFTTTLSLNRKAPAERGGGRGRTKMINKRETMEPRTEKMSVEQDWTAVYPSAKPFRPDSIPLPVRMGYPMKGRVPPEKQGNLELIKIPNFLHLTPLAIKKHCEALKPFCTEWPSALDTDAKCDQHFPIKVECTDYVSAGPSLRNPSARIVQLRIKLSSLSLDEHARKKFLKLVGDRYCKSSDTLTIKTDSCPLRKQNYDYAMYLLTVLYHESWKIEAWEAEKTREDMEEYMWEDSTSQKNVLDTLIRMKVAGEGEGEEVRSQLLGRPEVQEYKDSVSRLKNEGDSESTMLQYKEAVKKLLSL